MSGVPDREKVIAALHCRAYDDDFPCCICAYYKQDEKPFARCDYRGLMDDAIALLKEQETVVHCRECKLYEKCELNDLMLNHENGFCADGERKERNG